MFIQVNVWPMLRHECTERQEEVLKYPGHWTVGYHSVPIRRWVGDPSPGSRLAPMLKISDVLRCLRLLQLKTNVSQLKTNHKDSGRFLTLPFPTQRSRDIRVSLMGAHKQGRMLGKGLSYSSFQPPPQGYQNLHRVPGQLPFPPSPKSVVPAVKGRPEDKWNRENHEVEVSLAHM